MNHASTTIPGEQPNIVDLLKQLRDDTTLLVREEVALAKTEMAEKASTVGRNAAFIAAGAMVAFSALILLLFAFGSLLAQLFLEQGMGEGTAAFLGFGIVALVVGAIGAGIAMSGLSTLKKQSLAPEKTIETLQEDKQWAQNRMSS